MQVRLPQGRLAHNLKAVAPGAWTTLSEVLEQIRELADLAWFHFGQELKCCATKFPSPCLPGLLCQHRKAISCLAADGIDISVQAKPCRSHRCPLLVGIGKTARYAVLVAATLGWLA